jgi:hypothetical protein
MFSNLYKNIEKYFLKYNINFGYFIFWLAFIATIFPQYFKEIIESINKLLFDDFRNLASLLTDLYFKSVLLLFGIGFIFLILDSIDGKVKKKTKYNKSISGDNWSFYVAMIRIFNIVTSLAIDVFPYIFLLILFYKPNTSLVQLFSWSSIFGTLVIINIIVSVINLFNTIFIVPSINEELFPKTYILGSEYSSYTELRRVVNNQNKKTYILLKNRSGRYYVVQEQVSQNTNGNSPQNKYLYKVLNSTRDFSEAVYSFESNK